MKKNSEEIFEISKFSSVSVLIFTNVLSSSCCMDTISPPCSLVLNFLKKVFSNAAIETGGEN